jgi:hypothetical protein
MLVLTAIMGLVTTAMRGDTRKLYVPKFINHTAIAEITNRYRVVASMTTVPSRIDHILPMIQSVLEQTARIERIEINIPLVCVRTNQTYVIPTWLSSMQTGGRVKIYRTPDYGSITKVAPTLLRYRTNGMVYVWSVDDDRRYPNTTLADLLLSVKRWRKGVLAFVGAEMNENGETLSHPQPPRWPHPVSIVKGYGTILYPPAAVKSDFQKYVEFTSNNSNCRKSDDIVLSNYLEKIKLPRFRAKFRIARVRFNKPEVGLAMNWEGDALQMQDGGHAVRYVQVVRWLHEHKMLYLPIPASLLVANYSRNSTLIL